MLFSMSKRLSSSESPAEVLRESRESRGGLEGGGERGRGDLAGEEAASPGTYKGPFLTSLYCTSSKG